MVVKWMFIFLPHSSFLTVHPARTSLRVCVIHLRSRTDAFTCLRSIPGTAATSNTTAPLRRTFSAPTWRAAEEAASPARGGSSEGNPMSFTGNWANHSPRVLFTSQACVRRPTSGRWQFLLWMTCKCWSTLHCLDAWYRFALLILFCVFSPVVFLREF